MSEHIPVRPLRIASFTYSTKPRGGVAHTLALAEHLRRLGHHVHVFALGKGDGGFFRPVEVPHTLIPVEVGPEDEPLDVRIARYIQTYYDFLSAHSGPAFDVYHSQDCVSANALWRLREDGLIPAFIRTVHHIDDFISPVLIKCQDDSLYRPDQRIVVSRAWQQALRQDYGLESQVIYNGVDLGRFKPGTSAERESAREALGLGDQVAFLSIGGIEPRKNAIRLLKAFEEARQALAERGKAAALLFVGGETLLDYAAYRAEFFELLDQLGLEEGRDIFMIGVVPDDMIPRLYHAADVLAFPSVKEGWGLVVLEAMASGLPVLASDLPVFREYLRDAENALLVDPLDVSSIAHGLVRIATDDPLRAWLRQEGLHTAAAFGWEKTAAATAAFYAAHLPVMEAR